MDREDCPALHYRALEGTYHASETGLAAAIPRNGTISLARDE